jgi:hypothetical protein
MTGMKTQLKEKIRLDVKKKIENWRKYVSI